MPFLTWKLETLANDKQWTTSLTNQRKPSLHLKNTCKYEKYLLDIEIGKLSHEKRFLTNNQSTIKVAK